MSEYKISCPNCSQHISLDDAWSGRTLNCPACQKPFTVPQLAPVAAPPPPPAPAPAAAGLRMSAPSAPPAPSPGRAAPGVPAASAQPRTCGLAIASLILSLLGCALVTAIAGVICGHMALKRIRNNAALSGRGLALAGVIIGYVMIALGVAGGIKFALDVKSKVKEIQSQMSGQMPPDADRTSPTSPALPGAKVRSFVPAPADAVSGTIKGEPFKYTRSMMAQNTASLEIDGREVATEGIVMEIFLGKKSGESLENRTWHITPTTAPGAAPTIFIIKFHGGSSTKDRITSGYEMDLTTGPISGGITTRVPGAPARIGGTIAGTITLKVNGAAPVDIKGNFTAQVN